MTVLPRIESDAAHDRLARGLVEAVRSLTALGDAVESLPTQASPQVARAVQVTENLIRSIDVEFGLLGAAEAGQALGSTSKAARNLAGSKHRAGELLAIRRGRGDRFPGFQFQPDGSPLPAIGELRTLADQHDWSELDLFLWLVTPCGGLDGRRPVDLLHPDDDAGTASVLAAAEREMLTQW